MFPLSFQNVNQKVTEKYLNYESGFFIEAGGADGYTQSNTWHLEKYKNWQGILVEPNPDAAETCRNERPNSVVYNYALVSEEYKGDSLKLLKRVAYNGDPGLMSAPADSDIRNNQEWSAPQTTVDSTEEIIVPTTSLNAILENTEIKEIDFLSLDVEGYELEVLKGLDLKKYPPKVMLIEWFGDIKNIEEHVKETHVLTEKISDHDYVFVRK